MGGRDGREGRGGRTEEVCVCARARWEGGGEVSRRALRRVGEGLVQPLRGLEPVGVPARAAPLQPRTAGVSDSPLREDNSRATKGILPSRVARAGPRPASPDLHCADRRRIRERATTVAAPAPPEVNAPTRDGLPGTHTCAHHPRRLHCALAL